MSGEPTPNDTIEGIIGQSAAGEGGASEIISQEDMRAMADGLELLTADFGSWKNYKAASTKYVEEFAAEISWHRRIRLGVAIACAVLVLFLTVGLVLAVLYAQDLFRADQSNALTALIVGCITGSVVVTIALVKGAFSNLADRNAGLPMPEHMKEIVDAARNIMGGLGKS